MNSNYRIIFNEVSKEINEFINLSCSFNINNSNYYDTVRLWYVDNDSAREKYGDKIFWNTFYYFDKFNKYNRIFNNLYLIHKYNFTYEKRNKNYNETEFNNVLKYCLRIIVLSEDPNHKKQIKFIADKINKKATNDERFWNFIKRVVQQSYNYDNYFDLDVDWSYYYDCLKSLNCEFENIAIQHDEDFYY